MRFDFLRINTDYFRREYKAWKLRQAKRRFQVYLKEHGSDQDTWVNEPAFHQSHISRMGLFWRLDQELGRVMQ